MRPPRIPNWLHGSKDTIYFITLCVESRDKVLASEVCWEAIIRTFERLDQWDFPCVMVIPDHLHFFASPMKDRDASVSMLVRLFKRWLREDLQHEWKWQSGAFDRLLRDPKEMTEKWDYVRTNPVRSGLVQVQADWPYQFGFTERVL